MPACSIHVDSGEDDGGGERACRLRDRFFICFCVLGRMGSERDLRHGFSMREKAMGLLLLFEGSSHQWRSMKMYCIKG